MANMIQNRLSVIASPAEVARFVGAAEGFPHRWSTDLNPAVRQVFSFHRLVPIAEHLLRNAAAAEEVEHERAAWGIKWGDVPDPTREMSPPNVVTYSYETPWGPGDLFLAKLGWKWTSGGSNAVIVASWSDRYFPCRGRIAYEAGIALAKWREYGTPLRLREGAFRKQHELATWSDEERERVRNEEVATWASGYLDGHDGAVAGLLEAWRQNQ